MMNGERLIQADRRQKVLWVSPDTIFEMLSGWSDGHSFVNVAVLAGIVPSDAKVVGVIYDPMCRAFGIFLWHESFTEPPDGECFPSTDGLAFRSVRLETRTTDEGYLVVSKEQLRAAQLSAQYTQSVFGQNALRAINLFCP